MRRLAAGWRLQRRDDLARGAAQRRVCRFARALRGIASLFDEERDERLGLAKLPLDEVFDGAGPGLRRHAAQRCLEGLGMRLHGREYWNGAAVELTAVIVGVVAHIEHIEQIDDIAAQLPAHGDGSVQQKTLIVNLRRARWPDIVMLTQPHERFGEEDPQEARGVIRTADGFRRVSRRGGRRNA